ncbi:hypothetical protein [Niallia sp. NCCP-28]|uniref:hypothetical protein n=1 Tax=Niallia sp. NCCP-28 TaxID=2934712 RepID=UPI0020885507|nr:hypothetical protein [Niallia sp. NCCP-28]GKU84726.1 hypothetical protein NCCP28_41220 [Niallia sp. NCCP-28]
MLEERLKAGNKSRIQHAKAVLKNPQSTLEKVAAARTFLEEAIEGLAELTRGCPISS